MFAKIDPSMISPLVFRQGSEIFIEKINCCLGFEQGKLSLEIIQDWYRFEFQAAKLQCTIESGIYTLRGTQKTVQQKYYF